MTGFVSAMQGFAVIGIVILTGYIAARLRIGGSQAQEVLHRMAFFIATPCLMLTTLARQDLSVIFHPSIIVAFLSALIVMVIFIVLNRIFFHMKVPEATVGCLNSMYLNSNNIGLPVARYILGNPGLVAPILVMQQALFAPIALTVLDISTSGKASVRKILMQPVKQPILVGTLLGIAVSWIDARTGVFILPDWLFDPINMIGESAVPMILMAFGMSLHGSRPMSDRRSREAVATVVFLKNVVMPLVAFLLAYFMMGFRGATLYGCVVLAALPCAQNVYNYAARYNTATHFARDGILFSTLFSPLVIAVIALILG